MTAPVTPRISAATREPIYSIVAANPHYAMRKNVNEEADVLTAMLDPTVLGPNDNHLLAIMNNLCITAGNVYRHDRNVVAYFVMHDGTRQVEGRRNGTFFIRYDLSAEDFTAEQAGLMAQGYVNLGGMGWPEYIRELHPELDRTLNDMQARNRNREPEYAA